MRGRRRSAAQPTSGRAASEAPGAAAAATRLPQPLHRQLVLGQVDALVLAELGHQVVQDLMGFGGLGGCF